MLRKCSPRNWHCYSCVQGDCVYTQYTKELTLDGYTQTLKPNCDKGKSECVCSSVWRHGQPVQTQSSLYIHKDVCVCKHMNLLGVPVGKDYVQRCK